MKRTFLLLAFGIIHSLVWCQSTRMVLVEEFTQASCGPCAAVNPDFNALLNANTSKVIPLKYQVAWPGIDPMNGQNPAQVQTRVLYYGVPGVPEAALDGNVFQGNPTAVTQQMIDAQAASPSPFDIALKHWFNAGNDSIFVHCTVTASQAIALGQPRLRIAMIEEEIAFTTPPGSNGETVFEQVMRKMYPSALGYELENAWTVGAAQTFTFKAPVPSYIYNHNAIAMVAWVQDDANKHIHQAAESNSPSNPIMAAPVAEFSADVVTSCDGLVRFHDQSINFPATYHWEFGDGQSSNLPNPSHLYIADSTFSVKLTVTNANGVDSIFKARYIEVTHSGSAPIGTDGIGCSGGTVQLSAVAPQGGAIIWQDGAGNVVGQGNNFVTTIAGTRNYYASVSAPNGFETVGIPNTIPGGSQYYNASTMHGLFFDVTAPCRLISVDLDAGSAGSRTIVVLDANGDLVHSATVSVPAGYSTVNLGFDFEVGSQYLIKIGSSNVDLYRDLGGALYPYQSSALNITGCTSSVSPDNYYFFYNWLVQPRACQSLGTVVTAIDTCATTGLPAPGILDDFHLAPNPNSGQFNLAFESIQKADVTVTVRNTLSQVVFEERISNFRGRYSKQLDLGNAVKGLYLVTVSSGQGQLTRRLILE